MLGKMERVSCTKGRETNKLIALLSEGMDELESQTAVRMWKKMMEPSC